MFDELESFLNWWLSTRPIVPPKENVMSHNGCITGAVLFRQGPYQVQIFTVLPDSVIEPHVHPNVDSYEVYISGDIVFHCDDIAYNQTSLGDRIRVKPSSWHGGKFGARGGVFLSVQKWENGIEPSSVGNDWHDKQNRSVGTADPLK